ncbi:unnamed protein product [Heterobilharzia americana]|nr:unnamed protein product [Heterobilharzia americana]
MKCLQWLLILLFTINLSSWSLTSPVLTEISTLRTSENETFSSENKEMNSTTEKNPEESNSTYEYEEEEEVATDVQEELNSSLSESSASSLLQSKETESLDQELASSPLLGSTIPETNEYQDISSNESFDNTGTTIDSVSSFRPPEHEIKVSEPTVKANDNNQAEITYLLNRLEETLGVPSTDRRNYQYITVIKSSDGSIYVPYDHQQSTRQHLITLLGFAEQIVSSKAGIATSEYRKDHFLQYENFLYLPNLKHILDLCRGVYTPEVVVPSYVKQFLDKFNKSEVNDLLSLLNKGNWTKEQQADLFRFAYICYGLKYHYPEMNDHYDYSSVRKMRSFCPTVKNAMGLSLNHTVETSRQTKLQLLHSISMEDYPQVSVPPTSIGQTTAELFSSEFADDSQSDGQSSSTPELTTDNLFIFENNTSLINDTQLNDNYEMNSTVPADLQNDNMKTGEEDLVGGQDEIQLLDFSEDNGDETLAYTEDNTKASKMWFPMDWNRRKN